jgi:hypothetical protein
MRSAAIAIVVAAGAATATAQSVSVNYDSKTVAAMAAAFGAQIATELYYNQQVQEILQSYTSAEIAGAAIFASKFLDRQALTDFGLWTSSTENHYYRRVYTMVTQKIIPKMLTVAAMMLRSPHNALYWGSYMVKITQEIRSLCMQFESIVTNGRLTFNSVNFLEVTSRLKSVFTLSGYAGIDWKSLLDSFGGIATDYTKENLKAQSDKLYDLGTIAGDFRNYDVSSVLLSSAPFNNIAVEAAQTLLDAATSASSAYSGVSKTITSTLKSLGNMGSRGIFTYVHQGLDSWTSDYVTDTSGYQYTQTWQICYITTEEETLASYEPSEDHKSLVEGSEWIRYTGTDDYFIPEDSDLEGIRRYAEQVSGWSQEKVDRLNSQETDYTYNIDYRLHTIYYFDDGGFQTKAFAYAITVIRSHHIKEVVYEATYDSFTMDLEWFTTNLNALLAEYNDNEEGKTYQLQPGAKSHYLSASGDKVRDAMSAMISMTCHDGATLMDGTTQYKCRQCGKNLDDHARTCSMASSVDDESLDLSELDRLEQQYKEEKSELESQIADLEAENQELSRRIATASGSAALIYRQQYNNNLDKISVLKAQIKVVEDKQKELQQARDEAQSDDDEPTDDHYRIPAIMREVQCAFTLSWSGDGKWQGYTYVRHATTPNINGTLTFTAELRLVRGAKYFLGIKIHRAIIAIDWKLTASYSDTQMMEVLTFTEGQSEEERVKAVNASLSALSAQYPDCTLSVDYLQSGATEEDTTTDTHHLLWASDRLEIARQVDSRLSRIYADLVSLEKMMHYKLNIIDILKNAVPFNATNHSRGVGREAYDRWRANAKTVR